MPSLVPRAASAASTSARTNLLIWLVAFGVFVLAALFVTAGYSPAWCSGCHAMRVFADAQRTTSHRGVACGSCHAPGIATYAELRGREVGSMWPAFLRSLGSAVVTGPSVPVSDDGCLACHRGILTRTVEGNGLRMQHPSSVRPGEGCVDCHGRTAHGRSARAPSGVSMEQCVRCHDGIKASGRCDLCHAAKLASERIVRGPWAVTHGPNWQQTHGLGDLYSCRVCHGSDYCKRCHGIPLPHSEGFPGSHGKVALEQRAQCLKCHGEKSFCTACHGLDMPHPAGFLPGHTTLAKSVEDARCARCHPRNTCDDCHTRHTHPGRTNGRIGGSLPKVGVR